jgi:hypothetical protein
VYFRVVDVDRFKGATMTSRLIRHSARLDTSIIGTGIIETGTFKTGTVGAIVGDAVAAASTGRRAGLYCRFGASSLGAGLLSLGLAVGVMTPVAGLTGPTAAVAQVTEPGSDADYSQFYDQLEEHGRWMEHPRWGYVWLPNADDGNWRPYTVGHWVNTEEHGWYWNSDEPWGWATYHYGRWVRDDEDGWLWIPGRDWAPAWVAWRESDEHIGWAPLPPEAAWEPGRGQLSFASSYYDSPRFAPLWTFVRPMHMVQPGLHRYILPRSRAPYILRNTSYVTNYSFVDRRDADGSHDQDGYRC